MTDGRFNVLAAVDRQLRLGALPPGARLEHPGVLRLGGGSTADLVAQFAGELEALGGVVHRETGDAAAIARVLAIVGDLGASRVLAWDQEWLNCPGLAQAITARGVALESCWLPSDPDQRRARLAELDAVPVGLTGAHSALADTGSLAVVSGPGRGRIASLLAPAHIAVLRLEQIVPSYAAMLASHPHITDEGSNLVLITGPSRTADIEMTLTRGVHGPGVVHVVVVE